MSHLTENPSIRTCNTLDSHVRTIDIPLFIHRRIACLVDVAGCHLTVCKEFLQPLLVCYKTTFTMRRRVRVNLAHLCLCQPWRFIGHHFCINHLGNMTSDGVICQCRRICFLLTDFTVRNQTKFDQCLETVTDTKAESVTLI